MAMGAEIGTTAIFEGLEVADAGAPPGAGAPTSAGAGCAATLGVDAGGTVLSLMAAVLVGEADAVVGEADAVVGEADAVVGEAGAVVAEAGAVGSASGSLALLTRPVLAGSTIPRTGVEVSGVGGTLGLQPHTIANPAKLIATAPRRTVTEPRRWAGGHQPPLLTRRPPLHPNSSSVFTISCSLFVSSCPAPTKRPDCGAPAATGSRTCLCLLDYKGRGKHFQGRAQRARSQE